MSFSNLICCFLIAIQICYLTFGLGNLGEEAERGYYQGEDEDSGAGYDISISDGPDQVSDSYAGTDGSGEGGLEEEQDLGNGDVSSDVDSDSVGGGRDYSYSFRTGDPSLSDLKYHDSRRGGGYDSYSGTSGSAASNRAGYRGSKYISRDGGIADRYKNGRGITSTGFRGRGDHINSLVPGVAGGLFRGNYGSLAHRGRCMRRGRKVTFHIWLLVPLNESKKNKNYRLGEVIKVPSRTVEL